MARKLILDGSSPEDKQVYRYMYESLAFPRKELSRFEERAIGRMLDKFEAIGKCEIEATGAGNVPLCTLSECENAVIDFVEEGDFKLLVELIELSKPAGWMVRTKLAIEDRLGALPKLEAKVG